jgi:DNA-directed RNA polymerase subunit RPC12/RpoP
MSQPENSWVPAWSTEDTGNPFEEGNLFMVCPKCGTETELMRLEKFPDFKGEIRVYKCSNCHHNNEVIVPA